MDCSEGSVQKGQVTFTWPFAYTDIMTRQEVFDAIKKLREGETVEVEINGVRHAVRPMEDRDYHEGTDGYCSEVLCQLRGRIRFATICWKDAGPNPKLYDGSGYFVNRNNLYGVVM
jgi:hypothetical protein